MGNTGADGSGGADATGVNTALVVVGICKFNKGLLVAGSSATILGYPTKAGPNGVEKNVSISTFSA